MKQRLAFKCASLGNNFVLLDCLDEPYIAISSNLVRQICDRKSGIGADGILVIKKRDDGQVEGLIFNADGSNGYKCLNGLRCIAEYLVTKRNYPPELAIFMGDKAMQYSVHDKIVINTGKACYKKEHKLMVAGEILVGHVVDVGNPHLVVLQKTSLDWLRENGIAIEQHQDFPNRTNVEFVWPTEQKGHYQVLVHERGCGITLACGTGAAAIMQTFFQLNMMAKKEEVFLHMQGGILVSYIDDSDNIIQLVDSNASNFTTSFYLTY